MERIRGQSHPRHSCTGQLARTTPPTVLFQIHMSKSARRPTRASAIEAALQAIGCLGLQEPGPFGRPPLHSGDMVISPQNSMGLDPSSAWSGREVEPRSIMPASSLRMSRHYRHIGACASSFKRRARGPQHDSVAHTQQAKAAECRPDREKRNEDGGVPPRGSDRPRVFLQSLKTLGPGGRRVKKRP
jgi:hypothetical protein